MRPSRLHIFGHTHTQTHIHTYTHTHIIAFGKFDSHFLLTYTEGACVGVTWPWPWTEGDRGCGVGRVVGRARRSRKAATAGCGGADASTGVRGDGAQTSTALAHVCRAAGARIGAYRAVTVGARLQKKGA